MTSNVGIPANELSGQVAVVTGGGRGIGRAVAQALAAAGAAVAVVARSSGALTQVAAGIHEMGGQAIAVTADVTEREAVERMVEQVQRRLGPVDLLVNGAGIGGPIGPAWEGDPDDWWRCLETNVRASLPNLCARSVLPGMIARRCGRIVNLASIAGLTGLPYHSGYVLSKTAIVRFSETLAAETRPHGIQVFAIYPGLVLSR